MTILKIVNGGFVLIILVLLGMIAVFVGGIITAVGGLAVLLGGDE